MNRGQPCLAGNPVPLTDPAIVVSKVTLGEFHLQSQPRRRLVRDLYHRIDACGEALERAEAAHLDRRARVGQPQHQTGLGRVQRRAVQVFGVDIQFATLTDDLQRRLRIGDGVKIDGILLPRPIDVPPLGLQPVYRRLQRLVMTRHVIIRHQRHLCTKQSLQKVIALDIGLVDLTVRSQHQMQFQPQLGAGCGHLPAVIRLHRRAGDHYLRAFGLGIGQAKFQHPRFVAAKRQSSQVVTLDINLRSA